MSGKTLLISALVLILLCGVACAPAAPAPPAPADSAPAAEQAAPATGPRDGGTIIVGLQAEPTTLDSPQISDYNSGRAAVLGGLGAGWHQ